MKPDSGLKRRYSTEEEKIIELIEGIKGLQVELVAFRNEMSDFKTQMEKRVELLDGRSRQCQVNPQSCSTARRLEEHITNDRSRAGMITGTAGCIAGIVSLVLTFIKDFMLRSRG